MDYTEKIAQENNVINQFTFKIGITASGNVKTYTTYGLTDQIPDLMPADMPDEDVKYFTGCSTVKKVRVIIEEI